MIQGDNNTIFVHMVDSEVVVELAYYRMELRCLVQVTRTETPGVSARCSTFCYIPRPERLLVMYLGSKLLLRAFSVDDDRAVWTRRCKIQGTTFHPQKLLVNSDKNLVVFDETFKRILIMNPNDSSYLQILPLPIGFLWLQNMLWCKNGIVLMHSEDPPGKSSGNYKLTQLQLTSQVYLRMVSVESPTLPQPITTAETSAPPEVLISVPSVPPEVLPPDPSAPTEVLPADSATPEELPPPYWSLSPEVLLGHHPSDVNIHFRH